MHQLPYRRRAGAAVPVVWNPMGLVKATLWAGLVGVLAACARPGSACSVPVFRYALERWPADVYDVLVFHRGGLPPKDQAVVDWLEQHVSGDGASANCRVRVVDVAAQLDKPIQAVWERQSKPELPWMVVCYPWRLGIPQDAWSGRLSADVARRLLDSPARREIGKRLLDGDSVVWVLLESGDRAANEAAAKRLGAELGELQKMLEPPESAQAPDNDQAAWDDADGPLRVAFSIVRVRRDDPAEAMLVHMLLRTEPDLHTFTEPMAFPVFGRGRVLYALVGKGINADTIGEACGFLVGPCFCQAKYLNPGVDLLTAVDWENGIVEPIVDEVELAVLTGRSVPSGRGAMNPTSRASPTRGPVTDDPGHLVRNVVLTLVAIGIITVSVSVAVRRRLMRD